MQEIIKRDGRAVIYDEDKIIKAMEKAFKASEQKEPDENFSVLIKSVCDHVKRILEIKDLSVEEIQNIVEQKLMGSKYKDVARVYITYRNERTKERNKRSDFMKVLKEKLMASNVQNQNANVDEFSFGGRRGEAASELTRQIALDNFISPMSRSNHINNRVYIHDLDSYILGNHNCLSVPFDDLLAKGFNTRQTDVRPAKSINTAFQLIAVVFQLQSLQQFGGVSATHLDWTMVPYVRRSFYKHYKEGLQYIEEKEIDFQFDSNESIDSARYQKNAKSFTYAMNMTVKELNQAVEGMYHNLNTLQSRAGDQLPFSSINYGLCTLKEGRMVTETFLNASILGVGRFHKTSIFPCGIFQFKKGINDVPGTPNYDLFQLAVKSTVRRLYPNYANCDWSVDMRHDEARHEKEEIVHSLTEDQIQSFINVCKKNPEYLPLFNVSIDDNKIIVNEDGPDCAMTTMGCRTYNGYDCNAASAWKDAILKVVDGLDPGNVINSAMEKDGRGNIAPNTIVLPTLAMEAKDESEKKGTDLVETFMALLDKTIFEAKEELLERYNWICSQNIESAKFMWENGTMKGYVKEEGIRSALKHGTLVIGQLGLAETLQILLGTDQTTEEGMKLAKRIEQMYKDRCAEYKKDYHLNFGVYYTPAENLCYTSMRKFQERYGKIPNVSDREYFTNSIHVPVWKKVSPFQKIDIESELTGYSSAGCITYVELDDGARNNEKAVEQIIQYAMAKDIPYFAINVPADSCDDCGYTGEMNEECPQCHGKNVRHLRRVTGYLTGDYKTAFNKGKQAEVKDRFQHSEKLENWRK
jgi:ribonucleoside-triphosphate reductase (formate)